MVIGIDYLDYITDVLKYLLCELFGHDPLSPCDATKLLQPVGFLTAILTLLLFGVSPFIHLIFVIDIQEMKELCRRFKSFTSETPFTASSKTA